MRELLSNRIQLFIRNREIMKKNFKLEYSMIHYLCSYIYTENNKILDPDKIKEAKRSFAAANTYLLLLVLFQKIDIH